MLASDYSCHLLESALIGMGTMSIYASSHRECGSAFLFEQRYWLQAIGVANAIDFRKKEARKKTLARLCEMWALDATLSFSRPTEGETASFPTVVLSSALLLAWLLHKVHDFSKEGQVQATNRAIKAYLDLAMLGLQHLTGDSISLRIFGKSSSVKRDGTLNLASLFAASHQLMADWEAMLLSGHVPHLGPLPHDMQPSLASALVFLEARCRSSGLHASDNPLRHLRDAMLKALSFGFEVAINHSMSATSPKAAMIQLLTKSGKRIAHQKARKLKWLAHLERCCGSKETMLQSLADGSHSLSAKLCLLENRLYLHRASSSISGATMVAVNWDAATYGGLSVNIALAYDIASKRGYHMVPQVLVYVFPRHRSS